MRTLEFYIKKILADKKIQNRILWSTFGLLLVSIFMIRYEVVLAKMLPGKNSNTFSIYIDLPKGSSIIQTKLVSSCVIETLTKENEITDIELFLGTSAPLDFAGLIKGSQLKNSDNLSEIVINLSDKHDRKEPSFIMVHRLRPIIKEKCEPLIEESVIKMIEVPAGPPTIAAVIAEIYGQKQSSVCKLAEHVKDVFMDTKGLVDIDILEDSFFNKYELIVNNEKISKSELTVKQVNDILYMAFEGVIVDVKNSRNTPEQIPIFLVLSNKTKILDDASIDSIRKKLSSLKLMNTKGMMVPLIELITIKKRPSNPTLMSKNLKKMTTVAAETDLVSQIYPLLDAREKIRVALDEEYEVHDADLLNLTIIDKKSGEIFKLVWDGELKVSIDTFIDLGVAFIAALVLIFLLMVIYYKNFTLSFIVLIGSFLSIIGVIIGHFIIDIFTQYTFFLTATSMIGFIALIGISSRNSLLLIDFTKDLMLKGKNKDDAIIESTTTRAKPIFLTAAAIILASTLLASDAVFGGLGVSLIFGTIAAVFASLIVVPVLLHKSALEKYL